MKRNKKNKKIITKMIVYIIIYCRIKVTKERYKVIKILKKVILSIYIRFLNEINIKKNNK